MVLQDLGIPWLIDQMNSKNAEQVNAAQYLVQTVVNALSGLSLKEEKKPDKELCDGKYPERCRYLPIWNIKNIQTCRHWQFEGNSFKLMVAFLNDWKLFYAVN